MSISAKLLLLLGIVAAFVTATVAFSGYQMLRIDARYSSLLMGEAAAATAVAQANRAMQTAHADLADAAASGSDDTSLLDGAIVEFNNAMDSAVAAMPADASLRDLRARGPRLLQMKCHPGEPDALKGSCRIELGELTSEMAHKTAMLMDHTQVATRAVAAEARRDVEITVVLIEAGLTALLGFGLYGARRFLVTPLRELSSVMGRLANADYGVSVPNIDRRDEIGEMARAVQVFKSNGLRAISVEADARALRIEGEEQRARAAAEDRHRAAVMTQATTALAEGLKHLSTGDLRHRLHEPFADDFERLRLDYNGAVDQLATTLATVSASTASIDAGSREISNSADDLSRRTEQQAASLEETAAALDQITANVASASARTDEARAVADEAQAGASRSFEVVSRAVDAIEKIERSSYQISTIIGVIDEIAFQVNLLALNAGVEASRAGDAGKGFAVVAQEVRELAQRSAHAAKEIKDLISGSELDVESGVALVRETGLSLTVIQGLVGDIHRQINAIAVSARAQSAALIEVNTAVNEMDKVTQQNAAMVEETNAASASLAMESGRLKALVNAFSLPVREPSSAARTSSNITELSRPASRRPKVAMRLVADDWKEF